MIGIYKITNIINKKVYIGQSVDIKKRWSNHRSDAFDKSNYRYNYPLYRAFRKYGLEDFEFSVIEECQPSELNKKEKYWISKYNSFIGLKNSWGYNQNPGGDSYAKLLKLDYNKVQEIKKLLKTGQYLQPEIADQFNVSADLIRRINNGRCWVEDEETYPIFNYNYKITGQLQANNYWKKHPELKQKRVEKAIRKKVYKEARLKAEKAYPTLEQLQRELNKYDPYYYSFTKIASTLGITRRILYRLLKKYNLETTAKSYKVQKTTTQKEMNLVQQYSLDLELINTFKSTREAAREVFNNEKLSSSISGCCLHKRKTFKGFIWKYKKIVV